MIDWLNTIDWCLVGALVVLTVYQLYFYLRILAAPLRNSRPSANEKDAAETTERPGVSVIVSARNEAARLKPFLQALLEQDYPLFEVIVVNDASEDETALVLQEYSLLYPRLQTTFVPLEARVRSSKKLALTLAVKHAKYEYLLLTDADCRPESKSWISEMMQGFVHNGQQEDTSIEVVLGYSPYFPEDKGINRLLRYDTLFNGLHYMGRALTGHPYMGVGRNLMYRKSLFERNHGFAGLINFRAGDDDLFINKVATGKNTTVVCTPGSVVWSLPKTSFRDWWLQKRRHLSVAPHYRFASKMLIGLEPMARGLWYAILIAAFVIGSAPVALLAWSLLIIRLLTQLIVVNLSARRFGEPGFGLEIVWYDICLPILTAMLMFTQRKKNYSRW